MKPIFLTVAAALAATQAAASGPDKHSQIAIHCTFSDIPAVTFSYSWDGRGTVGAMTVGGRGPVPMILGSGSMRFESANIDGYHFRWSPANSWMDVEKSNKLVRTGQGDCRQVAFGSTNKPLSLK